MTDHPFDRLARLLSGSRSRRQALAALGALAAARLHPAQAATQSEVAGCGAVGAVCTMIKGCCDGLVCATSMINPNYGVCISGEGEQVAVTSQLVVPGSDGVMAQLAAELAEAEADGAEGAQVIEARQSAQQTRRDQHHDGNHDDLYGLARDMLERGRVLRHDRGLPGQRLRQQ